VPNRSPAIQSEFTDAATNIAAPSSLPPKPRRIRFTPNLIVSLVVIALVQFRYKTKVADFAVVLHHRTTSIRVAVDSKPADHFD